MKRKGMALALCFSLLVSVFSVTGQDAEAKKKIKLNKTKATIYVGKTVTLKVKGTKKKVKWSTSKKKVATVNKKGKVTGKKKGTAKITAKVAGKKLVCKVTVKKAKKQVPSIKATYDSIFGKMGVAVNLHQLQDKETLAHIKRHYSSITLENEMKPEGLLWPEFIKTEKAKKKTTKYVIPDTYKESTVPELYYDTIDEVLKIAKKNNLKMRAHTLIWHSQTPDWFFKEDYEPSGNYVSEAVMDARMEMFIRSVMHHVYTIDDGAYKDVVYAWDVANEYFHNMPNANWSAVYGNRSGKLGAEPGFLKKAFQIAYDELKEHKITDKVELYYNDYNTYIEKDNIIKLVTFLNAEEKICHGVGMQSHLDTDYPSVELFTETVKGFADAGVKVQITEFDVTINNDSGNYKEEGQGEKEQADYIATLMKSLVAVQKETQVINSFTLWGLCDEVSWRGGAQWNGNSNPLLFDKNINDPKKSYYAFMDAAK